MTSSEDTPAAVERSLRNLSSKAALNCGSSKALRFIPGSETEPVTAAVTIIGIGVGVVVGTAEGEKVSPGRVGDRVVGLSVVPSLSLSLVQSKSRAHISLSMVVTLLQQIEPAGRGAISVLSTLN